jgi:hypothetical protein
MEESEDFIVRFDDDDEHDMAATSGGSSASTTAVTLALRRKLAEQEREMQVRSPPVSACRVFMPRWVLSRLLTCTRAHEDVHTVSPHATVLHRCRRVLLGCSSSSDYSAAVDVGSAGARERLG